ncbi:MAG: hypothetical protein ACLFOY_16365 [Desulfatibacillaceae bacterium]
MLPTGNRILVVIAVACLVLSASMADAAWWKFGRQDDVPEIVDLKFNTVDVLDVMDEIRLARDDLEGGAITVRGRAMVGKGQIGRVDVSMDGGEQWRKVNLGDRGMFVFEFRPELSREYNFAVRALSTSGKSSEVEDTAFRFIVAQKSNTTMVENAFKELLDMYMAENRFGFMDKVHPDFYGNLAALEDAVSDDFRYFDNIRIVPTITRVVGFDDSYEVYFTFQRRVLATRSGKLLTDASASTCTFKRSGDGYKLSELAVPVIFGLSNPAEVATDFNESAVGDEVIAVDDDGNADTRTQGDTPAQEAVYTDSGTATMENTTLADIKGFDFDMADVVFCNSGDEDFCIEHNLLNTFTTGTKIQDLGPGSINDITSVPSTGYQGGYANVPSVGRVYAFQLIDGTYGIVEFTEVGYTYMNGPTQVFRNTFRWKYQPTPGETRFQ